LLHTTKPRRHDEISNHYQRRKYVKKYLLDQTTIYAKQLKKRAYCYICSKEVKQAWGSSSTEWSVVLT
ncbi:MAG: hypothetical protein AB8B32_01205, partial [Prochlorococcus sp.]